MRESYPGGRLGCTGTSDDGPVCRTPLLRGARAQLQQERPNARTEFDAAPANVHCPQAKNTSNHVLSMCCSPAESVGSGRYETAWKGRDLNGLADLADNPPNSLEYFQALRQFKSLFPLLEDPVVVVVFFVAIWTARRRPHLRGNCRCARASG